MSSTQKVIKNSLWLIIQPLILNIISIFVIGYIARILGKADYGKFIFAFSFVMLFSPLASMGLRALTVREIAEDKPKMPVFLGKILVLRFFLSLCTIAAIIIGINIMDYPNTTKLIVYIASSTIIFTALSSSLYDTFQAFEKMEYDSYSRFFSGILLTIFSLIILLIGFRLIGLTLVYTAGGLLGLLIAYAILIKKFSAPKLSIDISFWKTNLRKGTPFFFPNIVSLLGTKTGIIFLSSMSGDISVGIYAAANTLVDRLMVIPNGIGSAIFPALTSVYKESKLEAANLFKKFFMYLFMLGLPIAVGTTILSKPIITLIYGAKYQSSAIILQILVWWLFIIFLNSIQGWTLGAIHLEKKGAIVHYITTPIYIVLSLILIRLFNAEGAAFASIFSAIISFFLHVYFIRKYLVTHFIATTVVLKIITANIIMGSIVFVCRDYNILIAVFVGAVIYVTSILLLRVITKDELNKLWHMLIKRKK